MPSVHPAANAFEIIYYEDECSNPPSLPGQNVFVWKRSRLLGDIHCRGNWDLQKCEDEFQDRADDMKNRLSIGEKRETQKRKDKKDCKAGLSYGQFSVTPLKPKRTAISDLQ
jgi:hypothetical protein